MKKERGITLIALTITIIVLIILASITTYTGINTVKSSKLTKFKQELEIMQAEVDVLYEKYKNETTISIGKDVVFDEKVNANTAFNELTAEKRAEYRYFDKVTIEDDLDIAGLENEFLVNIKNRDVISLEGFESEGKVYYRLEDFTGKKKISGSIERNGVTFTASSKRTSDENWKISISNLQFSKYVGKGKIQYALKDSSNWKTVENDAKEKDYDFTINSAGTYIIRITDAAGEIGETEIKLISLENTPANPEVTFSTAYGRIDVIWLDGTSNIVATEPNAPILTANSESMTPVKWNSSNQIVETTETDTEWYNYTAGTGTEDNTSSKWANAKTANDSYFVWIPRYAYRITYYDSETSTEPTGYYDGYGMWKAEDETVKYKLESGIETVKYNGKKYIVHPAFQDNLEYGGWSSKLSGFWVAKFEMNGTGTTLKSTYGVSSTRSQTIGIQYTSARQATYGYTGVADTDGNTSYMYSHMMKNSEWGAVAYLTHSTYGRNGHEITINDSSDYYTGGASGDTGYITNVAQSTTGNVYGVYDMSGGAWERTAGFNSTDSNGYFSTYGWTTATGLTVDSSSTKYATKYNNDSSTSSGTLVYTIGKTGDSTKEVYSSSSYAWFSDYSYFARSSFPFFGRGGDYSDSTSAGVFYSGYTIGSINSVDSFRAVLCP